MKPLIAHPEEVDKLWRLYQGTFPHLADADRNQKSLQYLMYDKYTQMFHGPGDSLVIFRDLYLKDGNASFLLLTASAWVLRPRDAIRACLKEATELFDLHRIFTTTPSKVVGKALLYLGFHQEGTLRECMTYNDKRADVVVYSILQPELVKEQPTAATQLLEATFGKTA
jgi:hypothetical protein